jgi:putative aminopeptidase FrvX
MKNEYNFSIDRDYLYDAFKRTISVHSPVGYSERLNPVLKEMAAELGLGMSFDNRQNAYITLEGEDNSKTVLIGAHADTLGLMVRSIDSNGTLLIRRIGGAVFPSLESESVTVLTRDGREYTGVVICKSHSGHVFADAHTLERNEDTIRVLLDEDVHSKADVRELGIRNGDYVFIDPHTELSASGYLKSRFIDDKGAIACAYAALRFLKESGIKPKYRTIFAFPYTEEIGMGGSYLPEGVSEYIAVDIGLVGPELDGHEKKVSICAKDAFGPYNYELTNRLIELAKIYGIDYAVDLYYRYGTDANAAVQGGHDVRTASFGMAVYCSHGRERTHMDGLEGTAKLLLAYIVCGA